MGCFLLVNGLYSSAAAENRYEQRIQKLEELLELYFDENRILKKKLIELEKRPNSSTNQTAAVSTTKTPQDGCEANLKNCSKAKLCELSTYKIGSKPRGWKVGVYRKFVAEAKRRGLTCGVKTVNSSTNQTAAVSTTKTARDRCEADLVFCNEAVLCELATYGPLGNKDWKVGVYRKFADEAKQRGIACGVENAANTKIETNTKPVATTARARCDANIKGCSKQDLCAISTFTTSTGKRKWFAGDFKKFADEAKRRGLTCGVAETTVRPKSTSPKISDNHDKSIPKDCTSLHLQLAKDVWQSVLSTKMSWHEVEKLIAWCTQSYGVWSVKFGGSKSGHPTIVWDGTRYIVFAGQGFFSKTVQCVDRITLSYTNRTPNFSGSSCK